MDGQELLPLSSPSMVEKRSQQKPKGLLPPPCLCPKNVQGVFFLSSHFFTFQWPFEADERSYLPILLGLKKKNQNQKKKKTKTKKKKKKKKQKQKQKQKIPLYYFFPVMPSLLTGH
jgi:hypothetical protein